MDRRRILSCRIYPRLDKSQSVSILTFNRIGCDLDAGVNVTDVFPDAVARRLYVPSLMWWSLVWLCVRGGFYARNPRLPSGVSHLSSRRDRSCSIVSCPPQRCEHGPARLPMACGCEDVERMGGVASWRSLGSIEPVCLSPASPDWRSRCPGWRCSGGALPSCACTHVVHMAVSRCQRERTLVVSLSCSLHVFPSRGEGSQ